MRTVTGWIVDYVAPEIVRFRRSAKVDFASAPFLFEPPDWHAFFAAHGWQQRESATSRTRRPNAVGHRCSLPPWRRARGFARAWVTCC